MDPNFRYYDPFNEGALKKVWNRLVCPGGNSDVAVYDLSIGNGVVGGVSVAVTAYGDVVVSPELGAGAGLANFGASYMEGNVVGVSPGFASREHINGILTEWSVTGAATAGGGFARIANLNGQIDLHGGGWASMSLTGSYGVLLDQKKYHMNCSRH